MRAVRLTFLIGIVGIAISAFAQYPYPGQYGHVGIDVEPNVWQQQDRQQPPRVDGQVKKLTKKLNLTDGQQQQVRSILEDEQDQLQQVRENSSLSREAKKSKLMEIHQSTSNEIRKVLYDDQKLKYADLEKKQKKH